MNVLHEFILESIRLDFGLGRQVTMNALGDVESGPRPAPQPPDQNRYRSPQNDARASVSDHLMMTMVDAFDDLGEELAQPTADDPLNGA